MRTILKSENDVVLVESTLRGRIEIWLRGVLYTHTMDMDYARRVESALRLRNQKIAC